MSNQQLNPLTYNRQFTTNKSIKELSSFPANHKSTTNALKTEDTT